MGFDTIPAIPEDYPLYDWADWQSSRDALVPGGPTKYFVKEAWNAIVDGLANAITAAGQEWDTTYTTAAGAKITISYGKLTARAFNSIRLNIDRQMHLDWPWAVNPETRGYVGREDFKGRQDVGKACDLVYPEYILELVRKLNLLLEIMRGTGPICNVDVPQPSGTQITAAARAGVGARVDCRQNASTMLSAPALSRKAAHAEATAKSASMHAADAKVKISAPIYYNRNVPALISASGRSRFAAPAEPVPLDIRSRASGEVVAVNRQHVPQISVSRLSGSAVQADANSEPSLPLTPEGVAVQSSMDAEIRQGLPLPAAASRLSGSAAQADASVKRSRPVTPKGIAAKTSMDAALKNSVPLHIEAETQSGSHVQGGVESCLTVPVPLDGVESQSIVDAELRNGIPTPVSAAQESHSTVQADANSEPSLPLTPEGVTAKTTMDAELHNSLPAYVSISANSRSAAVAVLSAQKSAQAGCTRRSGTIVNCEAVDTGWLPPVWVNGGLWIRQVHDDPVQRENGDLEVS